MNEYGFLDFLLARRPSRLVRFPEPPLEKAVEELQALRALAGSLPPLPGEALSGALAALATSVWRAKGKLVDPTNGEPYEETRRIHRHVEGACDAFQQLGIRMSDWLGQPFDAGLPLKVLAFQPTPGVVRDTIIEVVRPAVFWQDRLLQVAEVVVGIPENSPPPKT